MKKIENLFTFEILPIFFLIGILTALCGFSVKTETGFSFKNFLILFVADLIVLLIVSFKGK